MKRLVICFFGFFLSQLLASGQKSGTFTYPTNKNVIRIAVQASDPNTSLLLKQAFRLHGGLQIVPQPSAASYSLKFDSIGNNGVRVSIRSTSGTGTSESFPVQGTDLRQAALLAADTAVQRITKRPGFFAGKLAFVVHQGKVRELYTSDLFFQGFRKLTSDRRQIISPDWSPDGNRILYSGNKSGGMDVYLMDMGTRVSRPIARYKGTNHGAVFDPFGRRAAMIIKNELCINEAILASRSKPQRITTNKSRETSPTWSPDGRRIILSSDIEGGAKLFEVILSGENKGRFRRIPTNISRECTEPTWNPTDPNILAFTASIGGRSQIVIYDFSKRTSRALDSNSNDEGPCWTNDGRHLLFSALKGSSHLLHVVDTVTNKRAPLHTAKSSFSSPDFVYPRNYR